MDASIANVGEKRRFPSWMLGKSDNIKAEDTSFTLKSCVTNRKTKTPRKCVDDHHHNPKPEDIVPEIEPSPPKRRRGKSSRVQPNLELEKGDDDDVELNVEDLISIANQECIAPEIDTGPQKSKKRKSSRRQPKRESEKSYDDDVELNVEDLISIANEYVRAGKDAKQQQSSDQICERGPETVSNEIIHACETVPTDTSINEGGLDITSSTGDPAQDMLNLFLGPLLNKPLWEEKKPEVVTVTDEVKFVPEYRNHNRNAPVGDKLVTKKKSSLKDMVAMFLD